MFKIVDINILEGEGKQSSLEVEMVACLAQISVKYSKLIIELHWSNC